MNPAFVEYLQQKAQGRAQTMTADGHRLGLIPSPILASSFHPAGLLSDAVIPASYDLRTLNRLTPVKDQGYCGSCWAFAAFGALESSLMPAETADFSENDLIQNSGYSLGVCTGGNLNMATAYLARWQGPISESDNPYPYDGSNASSFSASGPAVRKHIQNVIFFPPRGFGPFTDDNFLKDAVMAYGAIYATTEWVNGAYDATHHSYYDDGNFSDNHGAHVVCIVGWEDEYPASNFNKTPPHNGAFIIRNSWSAGWGENGYYYISYDDVFFGRGNSSAAFITESPKNYASVYQYDPLGWTTKLGYRAPTAWGANVFTASDNKPLTAVSFYTEFYGTSYEVYVYTDVSPGKPRTGTLQCSCSGTLEYEGYYTVALPSKVWLTPGQKFSVVIKLTEPLDGYPIAGEARITGYSDAAASSPGQSFIDRDGTEGAAWEDVSADPGKMTNICIKAFASSVPIPITSPASGDLWRKGETRTIVWSTAGVTNPNVIIQLMTGTDVVKTIANPAPNDGTFSWKIPATIPARADYFVRIKTPDGLAEGDSSFFSITPFLTVSSPASGDSWYRGESRMITWTSTGTTAPKATILLMHGSIVTKTLASGAPNSGSYLWKIPTGIVSRTDYFIKVKTTDGLASGASPKFAIKAPSITIISPSEGLIWPLGGPQGVSWVKAGPQDARVNIFLRRNGVRVRDIALGTDNDGDCPWVVPSDLPAGYGYDVKVITVDGKVKSISGKFWIE